MHGTRMHDESTTRGTFPMNENLPIDNQTEILWESLVDQSRKYTETLLQLVTHGKSLNHLVARGLGGDVVEKFTAFSILGKLPVAAVECQFPKLLQLCLSQRFHSNAENHIKRLPRAWVIATIPDCADEWFDSIDEVELSMFLSLIDSFDETLARSYANRALLRNEVDVREVANDFLLSIR